MTGKTAVKLGLDIAIVLGAFRLASAGASALRKPVVLPRKAPALSPTPASPVTKSTLEPPPKLSPEIQPPPLPSQGTRPAGRPPFLPNSEITALKDLQGVEADILKSMRKYPQYNRSRPHTISRHGAQISDGLIEKRAYTGIRPDGGIDRYHVDSTQWLTHEDALKARRQLQLAYRWGPNAGKPKIDTHCPDFVGKGWPADGAGAPQGSLPAKKTTKVRGFFLPDGTLWHWFPLYE